VSVTPPPEVPRGELTPEALGLFLTKFSVWSKDVARRVQTLEDEPDAAAAADDGTDWSSYLHLPGNSSLTAFRYAGCSDSAGILTAVIAANTLRAFPFIAPKRGGTLDRLVFEVNVGAAGNGRVGLYANLADDNLYPGALLADGGGISTNAAGVKSATVSVALTPGQVYWLAHVGDAGPTLLCLAPGQFSHILGVKADGSGGVNTGISVAFTYAALGSTFPSGGAFIGGVNSPALAYRVS
jgi:hypothetical protein